ncbi:Ovule protein [Caenorhabditis elegans]|uniref:Ovule protein n=1 Tax=Caenorhabditis elegans TaxID=6239 RepID=E4MVD0_CAEEL|nr:Ovule protein [Caenorhabditis elegans]CCD63247.1 Ovule protein [Caenorhabditis elegans]|eukprot:NP_503317.2 Uncharacterized protein CELE_C05E4.12 [Caenorhabditis elegans]
MFTPIIEELDVLEETSREDLRQNSQYSISFGVEHNPESFRNFESEEVEQDVDQKLRIEQIALDKIALVRRQ